MKPDSVYISFIAEALLLCICTIISDVPVMSVVALAVFLCQLAWLCFNDLAFTAKYFAFIFAILSNIIGCFAVEFSSIYLSRLNVYADFCGSLPLLITSRWLFIAVIYVCERKTFAGVASRAICLDKATHRVKLIRERKVRFLALLSYAMFLICFVCFIDALGHSVLVTGANRFQYYEGLQPAIRYASRVLEFLVVIPLIYYRETKNRCALAIVGFYFLYLFSIGTKFGTYFTVLSLSLLVYYRQLVELDGRRAKRLLATLVAVVAAFVLVAVVAHSFTSDVDSGEYLAERLAGEGELWWRTYDLSAGEQHPELFPAEIDAFLHGSTRISNNVGSHNGIYGIMYLTAPRNTVDSVLSQGWRFTEGGYAAAYYYFGELGTLLFSVVMGLVVFVLQTALIASFYRMKIIRSVALTYLSVLVNTALGMFLFSGFSNPLVIIAILWLLIDSLVNSSLRFNRAHRLDLACRATRHFRGGLSSRLARLAC